MALLRSFFHAHCHSRKMVIGCFFFSKGFNLKRITQIKKHLSLATPIRRKLNTQNATIHNTAKTTNKKGEKFKRWGIPGCSEMMNLEWRLKCRGWQREREWCRLNQKSWVKEVLSWQLRTKHVSVCHAVLWSIQYKATIDSAYGYVYCIHQKNKQKKKLSMIWKWCLCSWTCGSICVCHVLPRRLKIWFTFACSWIFNGSCSTTEERRVCWWWIWMALKRNVLKKVGKLFSLEVYGYMLR